MTGQHVTGPAQSRCSGSGDRAPEPRGSPQGGDTGQSAPGLREPPGAGSPGALQSGADRTLQSLGGKSEDRTPASFQRELRRWAQRRATPGGLVLPAAPATPAPLTAVPPHLRALAGAGRPEQDSADALPEPRARGLPAAAAAPRLRARSHGRRRLRARPAPRPIARAAGAARIVGGALCITGGVSQLVGGVPQEAGGFLL